MRRRLVGIVSQVFPSRETTTRKGRSNRTALTRAGLREGVPGSGPMTRSLSVIP